MKKLLSKLTVAFLCLCLVLMFAACNDGSNALDEEKDGKPSSSAAESAEPEVVTIVGKWEGSVDIKSSLELDEETMAKYSSYDFKVKMVYEFAADGKYSASADGENIREGVKAIYKNELLPAAAAENGMTVDQLVSLLGTTEEEYLDTLVDTMVATLSEGESGKYKLEDGKLFMTGEEEEYDEGDYTTCELSANTLKLIKNYIDGAPQEDGMPEIILTKVK